MRSYQEFTYAERAILCHFVLVIKLTISGGCASDSRADLAQTLFRGGEILARYLNRLVAISLQGVVTSGSSIKLAWLGA